MPDMLADIFEELAAIYAANIGRTYRTDKDIITFDVLVRFTSIPYRVHYFAWGIVSLERPESPTIFPPLESEWGEFAVIDEENLDRSGLKVVRVLNRILAKPESDLVGHTDIFGVGDVVLSFPEMLNDVPPSYQLISDWKPPVEMNKPVVLIPGTLPTVKAGNRTCFGLLGLMIDVLNEAAKQVHKDLTIATRFREAADELGL